MISEDSLPDPTPATTAAAYPLPLAMDDSPENDVPVSENDLPTYDPEAEGAEDGSGDGGEPADSWNPAVLTASIDELRDEMTASTAEWRRGSRRQMEAMKEFGTLLQSMGAMVGDLHQKSRQETAPAAAGLPDEWLHILIDLHDRVARTAGALTTPPAGTASFWPAARASLNAWSQAWNSQTEATGMLLGHVQALLRRAGLQPVPAVGQPFDPVTMQAVEVASDARVPDHQVIAEILPGWTSAAAGRLLRPAQVRVSRRPASAVKA
ncbi:MAG: nucleotide exchange factor GrpE [Verrucomicrobiota bacterium]